MLSSVVAEFPGWPRLLQWMCTGCGSFSWLAAPASACRIFRGVTALDPSVSSRPLTLRRYARVERRHATEDPARARPERIVQTAHVAPISSTLPHCDAT